MEAVLSSEPLLEFDANNRSRPLTKFERRGIGLGHSVWDVIFRRR
jgi:tRNA (guanine-N7-)-methyltransferase